ncbi:hypothetical protein PI125_g23940 [Phytophthora idaei]|nr:hypothetical protein PI125_g23940 [Phytophthora idaei]
MERSPSGFISRYTRPEVRRSDRPAFGWSWGAQREEKEPERRHSGNDLRAVAKASMARNQSVLRARGE